LVKSRKTGTAAIITDNALRLHPGNTVKTVHHPHPRQP
jgi:hypothetical protein